MKRELEDVASMLITLEPKDISALADGEVPGWLWRQCEETMYDDSDDQE